MFLAGDDALLPNSVKVLSEYIKQNPSSQVICSQRKVFMEKLSDDALIYVSGAKYKDFVTLPQNLQLELIAEDNRNFPPIAFICRDVLAKLNGFDERFMFEDLVFSVKFIESGGKYDFIPDVVYAYRVNSGSITRNAGRLFLYRYRKDLFRANKIFLFKYASHNTRWRQRLNWWLIFVFEHLGLNKKNKFLFFLYHSICNVINKLFPEKVK